MGNDAYEIKDFEGGGKMRVFGVGENCRLVKTIIDENVTIGNNVQLVNKKGHLYYDSKEGEPAVFVRDGIIIVARGAIIPDNFIF